MIELFFPLFKNGLILALLLLPNILLGQHTYTISIDKKFEFNRDADNFSIMGLLPQSIPNRQRVINFRFSPEIPEIFEEDGNRYYRLILPDNKVGKELFFHIEFDIELFNYDLEEARYIHDGISDTVNLAEYLQPNYYQQSNRKKFKTIAENFEGSDEEVVKQIFDYVKERLNYEVHEYNDLGARTALSLKKGDCTEYSDLMVTLCRAKGIPVRTVIGTMAYTKKNTNHAWVEVYIKNIGWVPFDPTFADTGEYTTFQKMYNLYVYYSMKRHNKYLNSYVDYYNFNSIFGGLRAESTILTTAKQDLLNSMTEAGEYYNDHNYKDAIEILDSLIAFDPANVKYLTFKGMSLARQEQFEEAHKYFQLAIGQAKHGLQKREVYYTYANYHALTGNLEYCISFLRKSLELGFRNFDHIKVDEDLVSVRDTHDFQDLIFEFEQIALENEKGIASK